MAARGPGGARGGGPDGDSSSDDEAPPAKVLPPKEQWEKGNPNAAANVDRVRTTGERRAARDKKDRQLIYYLRRMGVSETELHQRFRVPRGSQGPEIDGYIGDSRMLCEQVSCRRRQYFGKKLRKRQDPQTKKDLNCLEKEIEALEDAFVEMCSRVTKAGGRPMAWPDAFKLPVDRAL